MKQQHHPHRFAFLLYLLAATFAAPLGCSVKKTETAGSAADSPETPPAEQLNLVYPLPAGGADELLDFINSMAERNPQGDTDEARTKDIGDMMTSRVAAAERLLSLPAGKEQYGGMAARTKLESLRVLAMIGKEEAAERFAKYIDELSESDDQEIAGVGMIGKFQQQVDDVMVSDEPETERLIAGYRQLVSSLGREEPVFAAGQEAATMLRQSRNQDDVDVAVNLMRVVSETFSNHADDNLADAAAKLAVQAKMLGFQAEFRELMQAGGDDPTDLLAAANELLTLGEVEPQAAQMIMGMAQNLEYSGQVDTAAQLYDKVRGVTTGSEQDASILASLEAADKRIGLLGEPFDVVGRVVGGEELDWSDYDDKVVLIDFWATWCGPCLREVPNIRKNYDRYKDRGFDVIGVNLDDSVETVELFLEDHELPWATIVGSSADELGFENPNAAKYGVQAIPFLVLVDKTGRVAALHTRGPMLDEKLAELLGESAEEDLLEVVDPEAMTSEEPTEPANDIVMSPENAESDVDADDESESAAATDDETAATTDEAE